MFGCTRQILTVWPHARNTAFSVTPTYMGWGKANCGNIGIRTAPSCLGIILSSSSSYNSQLRCTWPSFDCECGSGLCVASDPWIHARRAQTSVHRTEWSPKYCCQMVWQTQKNILLCFIEWHVWLHVCRVLINPFMLLRIEWRPFAQGARQGLMHAIDCAFNTTCS